MRYYCTLESYNPYEENQDFHTGFISVIHHQLTLHRLIEKKVKSFNYMLKIFSDKSFNYVLKISSDKNLAF